MEIRSHSLYRDLYRVLRFPINIYDSLLGCLETIYTGREQNSIKSEHELVSDSTILRDVIAGNCLVRPLRCMGQNLPPLVGIGLRYLKI